MHIKQRVYWGLDDNDKVVIDVEETLKFFRKKLDETEDEKNGQPEDEMDEKEVITDEFD